MEMDRQMFKKSLETLRNQPSARAVLRRIRSVARLFRSRRYAGPDELFFAFEDLPVMGKEYWFLYFIEPGGRRQAVLTFGRAEHAVRVNETPLQKMREIGELGAAEGRPLGAGGVRSCAAVCWMYDKKKKVLIDSHAMVEIKKSNSIYSLDASSGPKHRVEVEGRYPRYAVRLIDDGKTIFSASAHAPKTGTPYEITSILRSPLTGQFGAIMVNEFFEFSGHMNGRALRGKAYLQKVVAVMPLAPWNWVRLEFAGGASFDFFTAKPFGQDGGKIQMANTQYLEIGGRKLKPGRLELRSWMSGEKRRWLLTGKDFYLAMESFALQPFVLRQKMTFRYDEYLVVVRDFAMKADGKTYTLQSLGAASGIVEEASGYLI